MTHSRLFHALLFFVRRLDLDLQQEGMVWGIFSVGIRDSRNFQKMKKNTFYKRSLSYIYIYTHTHLKYNVFIRRIAWNTTFLSHLIPSAVQRVPRGPSFPSQEPKNVSFRRAQVCLF